MARSSFRFEFSAPWVEPDEMVWIVCMGSQRGISYCLVDDELRQLQVAVQWTRAPAGENEYPYLVVVGNPFDVEVQVEFRVTALLQLLGQSHNQLGSPSTPAVQDADEELAPLTESDRQKLALLRELVATQTQAMETHNEEWRRRDQQVAAVEDELARRLMLAIEGSVHLHLEPPPLGGGVVPPDAPAEPPAAPNKRETRVPKRGEIVARQKQCQKSK